ncbi:MAG: CAP domain-containing protein, partial [Candidatus Pacebacteria bacterium]|nr:CAP domain-containing protein [Candidatus Paceibacterota bacterium]
MKEKISRWLRTYFIPHEGNDHKPHILRPRTVAFVCLIALVAEVAFMLTVTYVVPRSRFFGIIEANALVDETNQARTADNLGELTISPLLTAAAQQKANDMVANDYFAHTSPQGLTPWDWFAKVGYQFSFAGENLAVNFSDSQDVTNAWMNSPEHRANILNGAYTEIGIATAQGTYEGKPAIYVVQEFGTPASAPIAFVNGASAAVAASVPAETAPVKPVTKPAAKPITKPKPAASLSSSSAENVTTSVSAVAVNGVETTTQTRIDTSTVLAATTVIAPAPQLNAFQRLISDP